MITARILSLFCRENDLPSGVASGKNPLQVLQREFPDLGELVSGKHVLDFGCGYGDQAGSLAIVYGCKATGYDTNPRVLYAAQVKHGMAEFVDRLEPGTYDVVISQNAMEHFPQPAHVLREMKDALAPGGMILITFGPPWYAPYGSHMHFFCKIPWLNLLFPESVVMAVRAHYRQDGAKRYEEVESGLNKMSLAKFEGLLEDLGLEVVRRQYTAVKGWNVLTRIPLLRELLTSRVTVLLRVRNDTQQRMDYIEVE
jgi:SAM-dependent methyltransferase